jgi:hypothetical protein
LQPLVKGAFTVGDLRLGLFDLPGFAKVLESPVRARKGKSKPVWKISDGFSGGAGTGSSAKPSSSKQRLQALLKVARKHPEVMVKITGTNKEAGSMKAHLQYVASKADALEDEHGNELDAVRAAANDVMRRWGVAASAGDDNAQARVDGDLARGDAEKPSHDSRGTIGVHIMLSMPEGTNAALVMDAARSWAEQELENHQYVLALHTDRAHPHVHIVANNIGHDFKRLSRSREDLQRWREVFSYELQKRGIEAAATPRKARGVVKKGEQFAVRQATDRVRSERDAARVRGGDVLPQASEIRVLKGRAKQAIDELRGLVHQPTPAEVRARDNRRKLEQGLEDAVKVLRAQGAQGSEVAAALAGFLSTLPAPETALDSMKRDLQVKARPKAVAKDNSPELPNPSR